MTDNKILIDDFIKLDLRVGRVLDAKEVVNAELTESMAMSPGSSVSGLYFAHPEARYFGVGNISKDQVIDYAKRKQMPLTEIEKWLGPWLGY